MLKVIGIVGDSEVKNEEELRFVEELSYKLAIMGFVILTGGLGGIMEAASRGAKKGRGLVLGIIPTLNKSDANKYVDIVIPTGMGWTRNSLVALTADLLIAIGGKSGTLSEIAYAWMYGKPIIAVRKFGGWAEKLAGKRIDERRDDVIYAADSVEEVLQIINNILHS